MTAATAAWAPSSTSAKYGLYEQAPSPATTELTAIASPRQGSAAVSNPLHPDNPLFWFGLIGAATFGLMAFSTSVRVGKATASVAVGSTK